MFWPLETVLICFKYVTILWAYLARQALTTFIRILVPVFEFKSHLEESTLLMFWFAYRVQRRGMIYTAGTASYCLEGSQWSWK